MHSPYDAPSYVLTLEVSPAAADRLAGALGEIWNSPPVQFERPESGRIWLEWYFASETEVLLARTALEGKEGVLAAACRRTDAREWETAFRRSFRMHPVGAQLRICPVWEMETVPDDGRVTILIDPGLSFGTGEHFTTSFCLEMVDYLWLKSRPASLVDVGAGSGILAAAAVRLGYARVVALENDEAVLPYLAGNLRLNGVEDRVEVRCMDISEEVPDETFEVVCANLFAALLVSCAPRLVRLARYRLVLSGIREFEVDGVAAAFAVAGAREVARDGDGEWAGLVLAVD